LWPKENKHVRNLEDRAPEMQGATDVDGKYRATALDVMKLRSELYVVYIRTQTAGGVHGPHLFTSRENGTDLYTITCAYKQTRLYKHKSTLYTGCTAKHLPKYDLL